MAKKDDELWNQMTDQSSLVILWTLKAHGDHLLYGVLDDLASLIDQVCGDQVIMVRLKDDWVAFYATHVYDAPALAGILNNPRCCPFEPSSSAVYTQEL